MTNRVIGVVSACVLFALAGCNQDQKQASATPGCPDEQAAHGGSEADHHHYTGKGPQVAVVNDHCPIAGTHSVGKNGKTDQVLTREWRGQQVGFCCGNCLPVWDKMTDEQRQAALDQAQRNSRRM